MVRAISVLLLLLSVSSSAQALELQKHKKPQTMKTMKFKIAAVTEQVPRSGYSPNRQTYLAYMIGADKSNKSVKLVFRYLGYEDGLSADFADFSFVHAFKAMRDRSCDESWQSFSTKFVVGQGGKLTTLTIARFVSPDAAQDIAADRVLPCYVINAQGYKGSREEAVADMGSPDGEGK